MRVGTARSVASALSLFLATAAVASQALNVKGLFGKRQAEVEAILGKGTGTPYQGEFKYKAKGYESVGVSYGDEQGYYRVRGRVRLVTLHFSNKPATWKEALRKAGLSPAGVELGTGYAKGYFKNIKGIPAGFIGFFNTYEGQNCLVICHWSYMESWIFNWARPAGERALPARKKPRQ